MSSGSGYCVANVWQKMLKYHDFDQIFTFWEALVPSPLYRSKSNLVCKRRLIIYINVPNFILISLFCHTQAAETPKFCHFQLQHFVMSPTGGIQRKLNACVQLQTFPHPMVSKLFLYSNAFKQNHVHKFLVHKPNIHKLDGQTHKEKNGFGHPVGDEVRASPS